MPTRRKSSSSVDDFVIDFSKEVQGAGGGKRYKPGTYLGKIVVAKPTVSNQKGTNGLEIQITFLEGKMKGKKLTERLWASPKAYSRFRTLLEACGKKVPQKVNLVRIAKAVKGAELYFEIVDDEPSEGYKPKSVVAFDGFISPDDYDPDEEDTDDDELDEDDELDDDEDLDDDDEEEEDEDDDEDEDDLEDMDRADLKAYIKENDLDVRVKKSMDDDDIREAIREAEGDDDEDEEEEDEPEPPKRKKTKSKKKSKGSDDDLEDLDLDGL